jgi:xanthine dehydrogenase accessory factor
VNLVEDFLVRLATMPQPGSAVLVTVDRSEGSVPRDRGAWMAVFSGQTVNTIGGGHVELEAIRHARALLWPLARPQVGPTGPDPDSRRFALGPSLGQCCGGVVHLRFEQVSAADSSRLRQRMTTLSMPVALFGGGHVGRALIRAMAPLPFAVTWIDSRDDIYPADVPANVDCEHSDPPQRAVAGLAKHTCVLIMSFSHAEDLELVAACLARNRACRAGGGMMPGAADLPFIGLIGSKTKWATFRRRLAERGFTPQELASVTCPIGVPGIRGKEPEVIAVAVTAQLLQQRPATE